MPDLIVYINANSVSMYSNAHVIYRIRLRFQAIEFFLLITYHNHFHVVVMQANIKYTGRLNEQE